MRILLDENLPPRLCFALAPHEVYTTSFLGWKGLKNGTLLTMAEANSFEVFVTVDKNLGFQQNIAASKMAFIVLSSNLWPKIAPSVQSILTAIQACQAGTLQVVEL